MQSQRHGFKDK